jgi:hypothetical protein
MFSEQFSAEMDTVVFGGGKCLAEKVLQESVGEVIPLTKGSLHIRPRDSATETRRKYFLKKGKKITKN